MNPNPSAAKKISGKLARIISNSLSVSELRIYNLAEQADSLSFDALYLWVLKEHFSFTTQMLKQLFKEISFEAEKYKDYPLSGKCIPLVELLKEDGIDLKVLLKEREYGYK